MKKKALLLASLGVLACTVGVTTLAVGGANQLDRLQVKADDPIGPTEYSVTLDASDTANTTVEIPYESFGFHDCAICTTTARGNKLGVAGPNLEDPQFDRLRFREANFYELQLHDGSCALINAGANDFDRITGYKISFSGGSLFFRTGGEHHGGSSVTSGVKYDVSLTPDNWPAFALDEHSEDVVTITSLTIWYTC